MSGIRKLFGRSRKGKAAKASVADGARPGITAVTTEEQSSTAVVAGITTEEGYSRPQVSELYSTEGDHGMKVIAEPADAVLE